MAAIPLAADFAALRGHRPCGGATDPQPTVNTLDTGHCNLGRFVRLPDQMLKNAVTLPSALKARKAPDPPVPDATER
jgi:hypothetical protein